MSRRATCLLAIALGYEIGARVGIASKLRVTMHPHGTWGTVGAAVAVAKLDGADAGADDRDDQCGVDARPGDQPPHDAGRRHRAQQPMPASRNQLGLIAWEMRRSRLHRRDRRRRHGLRHRDRRELPAGGDGRRARQRWEIARNYFKRHAACRYTHGALDALGAVVREAGGPLDPARSSAIEVETYVWAAQLDAPEPRNMLAAKFSLPFALATTHRPWRGHACRRSATRRSADAAHPAIWRARHGARGRGARRRCCRACVRRACAITSHRRPRP